jgi:hypothetical protein
MHLDHFAKSLYSPRRQRRSWLVLLAAAIAVGCALPSGAVATNPSGAGATISVRNGGGKTAELLHRLTIPQLAAVLGTSPVQVAAATEPPNAQVTVELSELLTNPTATLQELLNFLAAHGVSTTPLVQFINHQLAGVGESADKLSATVNQVLADLGEDGQITEVANELALPRPVVESVHLLPSSSEQVSNTLHTSSERLARALSAAGATVQPLTSSTPLVAAPVEGVVEPRTTQLVGVLSGSGGLSLTTVSSTAANAPATAPGAAVSNAFTIVSIKVTKRGLILETVRLPGPGRLTVGATTLKKVAVRSSHGHKRSFTRRMAVASVAAVLSGGTHTFTLRPKGAASRARRLLVNLATTYTPAGGTPNTIQRSVIVRHAASRRHH